MRTLRTLTLALVGLVCVGCGGGSGNGGSGSAPGFVIASGNWNIPLSTSQPALTPFAGGMLTQNGNSISGTLYVTGSPCFDPVADPLTVSGSVSSDFNAPNALTLSSQPVRGQVLTVSATWDRSTPPTIPPPTAPADPVDRLVGMSSVTGGSCAGIFNVGIDQTDFSGTWLLLTHSTSGTANLKAVMSQAGPDTQGFFHVSGTFTVTGSPCFTSGTINPNSFAGDIGSMTVTMDSGQLVGSAYRLIDLSQLGLDTVFFSFTVHGGPCDGQTITTSAESLPLAQVLLFVRSTTGWRLSCT